MKTKSLYVGSFDPVTLGHVDIIRRASKMFSELVIAVGDNPNKKYMFSFQERVNMLLKSVKMLGIVGCDIRVESKPIRNLTADYARLYGYGVIIKGARTGQDFDYEKLIHEVSMTQQRNLETILLFSDRELAHVSSSAAKELARFQGLISGYVPIHVKAAIEGKLGQRIVGVTGTIGSGKSTLCKNLATPLTKACNTINYINMDEIGHELFTSELPIAVTTRLQIAERFGTVNRQDLGDIVFKHREALNDLNEIFRDPMLTLLRERLLGLKGTILLEGALFAEMGWLFLCNNRVILVKTPSDQERYSRLAARGLTPRQIQHREESQYTYDQKLDKITNTICHDGFGKCIIHDTERKIPLEDTETYKYVTRGTD